MSSVREDGTKAQYAREGREDEFETREQRRGLFLAAACLKGKLILYVLCLLCGSFRW